jgi:hypothetical protein
MVFIRPSRAKFAHPTLGIYYTLISLAIFPLKLVLKLKIALMQIFTTGLQEEYIHY